jgi:hypothetical protein
MHLSPSPPRFFLKVFVLLGYGTSVLESKTHNWEGDGWDSEREVEKRRCDDEVVIAAACATMAASFPGSWFCFSSRFRIYFFLIIGFSYMDCVGH